MDLLNGIDALIITNPTNIRYLTGFVGAAPEEREAYCLIAQECIYLFTSALYLEQSKNLKTSCEAGSRSARQIPNLKQKSIQIIKISYVEPFAKKLAETFQGSHLGFEENDLTVAEYNEILKQVQDDGKRVELMPTKNRIEELRVIKREDEIENIRAAAKITDECFDFILEKIRPGISESDISWEIEAFIRARGACLAFSPIVAFGAHTSQPHYLTGPGLVKTQGLAPPELVLLDFGAKVNGYCSDMTRTVFIGKPETKWVTAYETVLAAQQKALEYLTGPGPVTSRADKIARKVIQNTGFPTYPHSLGHGVGLDIHEAPRLTINPSTLRQLADRSGLQPNMVVTVEPGIYIEGQYGIRIEDLVLLKKDGIEILSKSKKEMIIL